MSEKTFSAQPRGPIVDKGGTASQPMVGYLNQFDLVESGITLGRKSPGVGPLEWLNSGGASQVGLTIALSGGGTVLTFDLENGRMVNAVVTP